MYNYLKDIELPKGFDIRVNHFHKNYDPYGFLNSGAKYATIASISREFEGEWEVVCSGVALCHKNEVINKKIGRAIAISRVLEQFWSNYTYIKDAYDG